MAKSKIIKDLANNTVDLSVSLKRAKVLLNECGKKEILRWIKNELEGYHDYAEIPSYRKIRGIVKGNFIIGSAYNATQYTNVQIPLSNLDKDIREELETCNIAHSITALNSLVTDVSKTLKLSITADLYPLLQKSSNISSITSAYTAIESSVILDILQIVENKLIDIFLILEKEFGNLDKLDIEFENKDEEIITKLEHDIYISIFNDNSIVIGDNNRIKDTNILSNSTIKE